MATRVRRRPTDGPGPEAGPEPAASGRPPSAGTTRPRSSRCSPAGSARSSRVSSKGKASPTNRTKFQVIALLVREERARVKDDTSIPPAARADLLKRLDGVATILAKTAARDTSLLHAARRRAPRPARPRSRCAATGCSSRAPSSRRGVTSPSQRPTAADPSCPPQLAAKQVMPQSVPSRVARQPVPRPRPQPPARRASTCPGRLAGWDLHGPALPRLRAGRRRRGRRRWTLPPMPSIDRFSPPGLELMPHQSRFLESVREGHRTFLLADEPGLGKTAQSVIAASVANAYPMLAVVPNVVKINWAREVERWTPQRRVTVIHGDGDDVDAFADVFVVNYEILDRHLVVAVDASGSGRWSSTRRTSSRTSRRSAPSTCWPSSQQHPRQHAGRRPAAPRPHRHAAHQRRRGLRRDLALPRLDQGRQARPRAHARASTTPASRPPTAASTPRRAAP